MWGKGKKTPEPEPWHNMKKKVGGLDLAQKPEIQLTRNEKIKWKRYKKGMPLPPKVMPKSQNRKSNVPLTRECERKRKTWVV